MSVAKITEISSSSKKSFDEAVRKGIARANKTLKNVKGAWIKEMNVTCDGGEVDERTPPSPRDFRGEAVLAGEQAIRGFAAESVALRLSGIYGPGRTFLVDRIASGQLAPPRAAVHGNRIWRDDAASIFSFTAGAVSASAVVSHTDPVHTPSAPIAMQAAI